MNSVKSQEKSRIFTHDYLFMISWLIHVHVLSLSSHCLHSDNIDISSSVKAAAVNGVSDGCLYGWRLWCIAVTVTQSDIWSPLSADHQQAVTCSVINLLPVEGYWLSKRPFSYSVTCLMKWCIQKTGMASVHSYSIYILILKRETETLKQNRNWQLQEQKLQTLNATFTIWALNLKAFMKLTALCTSGTFSLYKLHQRKNTFLK